jgi:hypothetical protein
MVPGLLPAGCATVGPPREGATVGGRVKEPELSPPLSMHLFNKNGPDSGVAGLNRDLDGFPERLRRAARQVGEIAAQEGE